MSEKLGKNQAALSAMFGGEKVALGEEVIAIEKNVNLAADLEQEVYNLPQEIILYLQTMSFNFVDNIEELISNVTESLKEKEAARKLWERFGLPKSTMAVPVFVSLNKELNMAQHVVKNEVGTTEYFLDGLIRAINNKIMLFYAAELLRVEHQEVENQGAISQLEEMDAKGSSVRERATESVMVFSQEKDVLEEEKEQILSSKNIWEDFMEQLKKNLPTLRSLEAPLDLGAPNPAMAL